MLSLALCFANTITQLVVLGILAWVVCTYVRLRRQLWDIKRRIVTMDLDEIIDNLLDADDTECHAVAKHDTTYQHRAGLETTHRVGGEDTGTTDTGTKCHQQHRERLAALAAGGRARQYLGKALSVDMVDSMGEEEVERLYSRYEGRLGAAMTKTLGAAGLQLYISVASSLLPIPREEQPKLLAELESDPFVEHAVSSATCELYHRFGMYLAPLTAGLATMKHCRFGDGARIDDTDVTSQDGGGRPDDTGTECRRSVIEHPDRVDGGGESDSAFA
jgi:hypothetical protein